MPTRSKLPPSVTSGSQHSNTTKRTQTQRQSQRRQKVSDEDLATESTEEVRSKADLQELESPFQLDTVEQANYKTAHRRDRATVVQRQERGQTVVESKAGGRKRASQQKAGVDNLKTESVDESKTLDLSLSPAVKRRREDSKDKDVELPSATPKSKRQKQSAKQEPTSPKAKRQLKSSPIKQDDNLLIAPDIEREQETDTSKQPDTLSAPLKIKRSRNKQNTKAEAVDAADGNTSPTDTKPKIKRKTKEEKEAEKMPLAQRTVGHKMYIGAHVSASGGVHKAVMNSVHIGGNAFALFLKSQRKWANPPLAEEVASQFQDGCKTHTYDAGKHVVPHGSYLVNLAAVDPTRTKQAYDSFLDDLQRCERLGIKLYNFHPGNTNSKDRTTAIKHLAGNINRAHKETKTVVTLLENMAAGGNIIGTTFEDLRDTIDHIDDKSRVGVCFDTCHAFAAGYDLRSPETFKATLEHFDEIVGLKYLRALHMNDSKGPLGCHRDLHAQIGTGYLGLRAFHNIINEPQFIGLPMVLETPVTVTDEDGEPQKNEKGEVREDSGSWAREIKLLESLWEMDVESEEFLNLETSLARKGVKERVRIGDQAERRKVKDAKKAGKAKKRKADESEEEDDVE